MDTLQVLTAYERTRLSERQPLPDAYIRLSDEDMRVRIAAASHEGAPKPAPARRAFVAVGEREARSFATARLTPLRTVVRRWTRGCRRHMCRIYEN